MHILPAAIWGLCQKEHLEPPTNLLKEKKGKNPQPPEPKSACSTTYCTTGVTV